MKTEHILINKLYKLKEILHIIHEIDNPNIKNVILKERENYIQQLLWKL